MASISHQRAHDNYNVRKTQQRSKISYRVIKEACFSNSVRERFFITLQKYRTEVFYRKTLLALDEGYLKLSKNLKNETHSFDASSRSSEIKIVDAIPKTSFQFKLGLF